MTQHFQTPDLKSYAIDGVSVIICTYNGASRIRPTLEALARCRADFPVEIILVDNNSNDGTAEVVRQVWNDSGNPAFKFYELQEPTPGQAFARRAGVTAAAGDIIVFCDDDNWLAEDYLEVAVNVMRNPEIGAAGGQSEPVAEGPLPTFLFSHGGSYALGTQSLFSGHFPDQGFLWGAGLVARRRDLLAIYNAPYLPLLPDKAGSAPSEGGNDIELCLEIQTLGGNLVYDERLKLKHYMPQERLRLEKIRPSERAIAANNWLRRCVAGIELLNKSWRPKLITLTTARLLWHWRKPSERHYYTWLLLAAFNMAALMRESDRKLFLAFKYLQCLRQH